MNIDYNALAAYAALFAALVSTYGIWSATRRSRFSLAIELVLKLDERFNAEYMRKARQAAARSILDKTYTGADDVLDFFEMLGLLVRRGALDEATVWHEFFHWLNGYWHAAKEHIERERAKDPTIWSDLAYLHKRLVTLEKHERRCSESDTAPSEDSLREFLNAELNLLDARTDKLSRGDLTRFFGRIPPEEADAMARWIEEACERIDREE